MSRAELIFHPVRMRILQAALRAGRVTAGELGSRLPDVPPATLYRHLKRLAEGGVLAVVEERPVRGVVERVYEVSPGGGAALAGGELAGATREDHLRYFGVFLAGLLGEFERYLAAPGAEPEADRVGYRQFPAHLSDAELDALLRAMDALLREAMRKPPRADRKRRVVTRVVLPGEGAGDETREEGSDGG